MANDEFLKSYIECALWSSTDDNGKPLDSLDADLAPQTITRFQDDCESFLKALESHPETVNFSDRQLAHDFWLTRNRHGAGFWDGDYPEPLATQLTNLAHSYGECDLYIGNDGKLYC